MRHTSIFFIILFFSIHTSCSKQIFIAKNFEEITKNHESIAVLPCKIIYTGKMPKNLTDEQIQAANLELSNNFTNILYNATLNGGTKKKQLVVDVQSIQTTQSLLKDNKISIEDSWLMNPQDLAQILNVDAVVVSEVKITRYMSDLASVGVTIATDVAEEIAGGILGPYIPNRINRTNDIWVYFSIVNAENASTLYSFNRLLSIDYRSTTTFAVSNSTYRYSRKLPYAVKSKKLK